MSHHPTEKVVDSSTSSSLLNAEVLDDLEEVVKMDVEVSTSTAPTISTEGNVVGIRADTVPSSIPSISNPKRTSLEPVGPPILSSLNPMEPMGPPVVPSLYPMLLQCRKAKEFFRKQAEIESLGGGSVGLGGYKIGCEELPCITADGKLLWILCILRDPQVQGLLLKFLSSRLSDMLKQKSSMILPRIGVQTNLPSMERKIFLPNEDVICKFAIQLCQLSLSNEYELPGLDQSLLRSELPMIMFDVLCASSSDVLMTDVLTASSSSSIGNDETFEKYFAQSSQYKQSVEIAKHAMEIGSNFGSGENQIQTGDSASRLNLFESIAKQLLDLNTVTVR